jgi:soluble lytic murein transglycosylase-like protein
MPCLRPTLRLMAALATCCLVSSPLRAELVILTSGEIVKVKAFTSDENEARLELPSGGFLTLPLVSVDRVIEDEVEEPVAAEPEPAAAGALDLKFADGAGIPEGTYGGLAYWAAKKHALNPKLVAAVARAESNWNPRAVSRKGACGLMQIMPATGRRFGLRRSDLFDIEKNLDAGSRYLSVLVDRFEGKLDYVLAAYNAGEGAVDRYGGVPPYRETRDYVRRIYGYLGLDAAVLADARPAQRPDPPVSAAR